MSPHSQAPFNVHPLTHHFEANLPLLDPLSQAAQEGISLSSSTHWRWINEREARRDLARPHKRRVNRKKVVEILEVDPVIRGPDEIRSEYDRVLHRSKPSRLSLNKQAKFNHTSISPKQSFESRNGLQKLELMDGQQQQQQESIQPALSFHCSSGDLFRDSLEETFMGRLILEHVWENTPLGPMEFWSSTLRSMVTMILSSPYRMSLLWGEEYVMIYNDAFVKSCGGKHPTLLGQCGAQGWAEIWEDIGDTADLVFAGTTFTDYDSLLFMDRNPTDLNGIRLEECYHSFSWIPVRGPTGTVEGIFNPSFETTSRVVSERRLGTLRDLVQLALISRDRLSYKHDLFERLYPNPYDIPFAIMYTCESRETSVRSASETLDELGGSESKTMTFQLSLAGSVSVPTGHPSAPSNLEFTIPILDFNNHTSSASPSGSYESESSIASSNTSQQTVFLDDKYHTWPLQEACALRKPVFIDNLGTRAKDFDKRGWNDEFRSAVVMPVMSSDDAPPLGVIVFGLSPRLYWTEAYATFLNLITKQISTGLSIVMGYEAEAQRLADMAALDRARTTFFTNVSHELRTPLTLIVGPISEIIDSAHDISTAVRDRLKIVERNSQRLINQVNQLLDLSRFDAGRMSARFRSTDLSRLVADLASLFRSSMHKNQLHLIVDCPESYERVWVDHDFIEKVIFNLISNSMKFTRKGGQVVVRVRFDSTHCHLAVKDTGIGINAEWLPKIFERFHRVEDSTLQAEGTGIGLSLVKDIIKLHHGHLDVQSKIGCGSTFTVSLLLGSSHLPADSLDYSPETDLEKITDRVMASNARRWMLGGAEKISPSRLSSRSDSASTGSSLDSFSANGEVGFISTAGSTILIADDNADMRSFVKSVLGRYFSVSEACDGQEAYQWAKEHQLDLIVSDVMMPDMDGFQLLKRLKDDPDTAGIPVILLSARADSESRIEGLAEGADDYMVKPFEAKELVARINTHLQLAKMRQRLEKEVADTTMQLRDNEAKYRDLYHTFEAISMLSPVGIVQWNLNLHITFANTAFRTQCKLQPGAPLDRWVDSICEEDRDRVVSEFRQKFEARHPTKGEFRWVHGSWCLYELSPHYDKEGFFLGCLGSTTDVTVRKESERKQLEAAESRVRDAEESKRQQEAFIDMTSHEIRNPLHGIHQAAELLNTSLKLIHESVLGCDGSISGEEFENIKRELEEDIDAVESIQLCASHQSRIADDIINVSKLSMGLLTTIKTEFDLVGRVREVLSMYLIEAQSKNVILDIQVGEGLEEPAFIFADPNRLAQVIINFLSNALRYTSASEGRRVVTVRVDLYTHCPALPPEARRIGSLKPELADETGGELVYAKVGVLDTAQGLSKDELAKLFARFAQANPTQDQYGGSGLGLYVSRCLIENHGGFIEVVSTQGQGSIFSFVIPAKRGSGLSKPAGGPRFRGLSKHLGGGLGSRKVARVEMRPATSLVPGGLLPLGVTKRMSSPNRDGNGVGVGILGRGIIHRRQTSERGIECVASPSPMPATVEKQTHVLVVEDNLINVKVIKRQLTLKGYAVSVAMDGREALKILYADDANKPSELDPIDIVLMDIQMPVMNGLDAITELRAAEKAGRVKKRYPVIAVTGNARKEQTEQYLTSGFDNICVKPYKIDDVQQRMETLLAACRIGRD